MSTTKTFTESCIWFSGDMTSAVVDSTAVGQTAKHATVGIQPHYGYVLQIDASHVIFGGGSSICPIYTRDDTTKAALTVTKAGLKSISITTDDITATKI